MTDRETNPQEQLVNLLRWVRDAGYWPSNFKNKDIFILPWSGCKTTTYQDLLPHQKIDAVWLPEEKTMRKILEERGQGTLTVFEKDGIYFAFLKGRKREGGVGVGPKEALLSVLAALRRETYLVGA